LPYADLPAQSGVLHDAYAAGRPVIGTEVGALGPSIREEGGGWVIPCKDVQALVSVLREVALSENERRRRGDTARRIGASRSPAKIAELLIEVYEKAQSSSRRHQQS